MRKIILAALLAAAPHAANATQFKTGNELVRTCQADASACYGYIQGAADMAETTSNRFCLQSGTTGVQLWQVTWNFMVAHPEDWNRSASLLAFAAFSQAFPCPKAPPAAQRRQDPTS